MYAVFTLKTGFPFKTVAGLSDHVFLTLLSVSQSDSLGEEPVSASGCFDVPCSEMPIPEERSLNSLCPGCEGSAKM